MCIAPEFNLIDGFAIDSLHSDFLGITKQLTFLWFDSTNHKSDYYIGQKVNKIDLNINQLKLPSNFKRNPRSITERKNWKANEWRQFLLYTSIGILYKILPFLFLKHFAKFVTAIWLLVQSKIEFVEIDAAECLIRSYTIEYQNTYGERFMTYNVHTLEHLAECVRNLGPLWAYSNFPFENNNGKLASYVKSPKGVLQQISNKYAWNRYLETKTFPENVNKFNKLLSSSSKYVSLYPDRTLGSSTRFKLLDLNVCNLECSHFENSAFLSYKRFVYNKNKYSTKMYSEDKKCNDSAIKLKNNTFGEIVYILKQNESIFAVVDIFSIDFSHEISEICPHLYVINGISSRVIISIKSIDCKCVLIDVEKLKYISPLIDFNDND